MVNKGGKVGQSPPVTEEELFEIVWEKFNACHRNTYNWGLDSLKPIFKMFFEVVMQMLKKIADG